MHKVNSINRREFFIAIFSILFCIFILLNQRIQHVFAASNSTISIQGKIVDKNDGTNVTSSSVACINNGGPDACKFRVSIYDGNTGSDTLLWQETHTNVEIGDTGGIFNLNLNSICGSWDNPTTPCSGSGITWGSGDLYIQIDVDVDNDNSYSESFPAAPADRPLFTSVPYSYYSDVAGTVPANSLDFTEFKDTMTLDNSTIIDFGSSTNSFTLLNNGSGDGIVNLTSTGGFNIQSGGNTYAQFTAAGNVGIGLATAPDGKLQIKTDSTAASGSTYGLHVNGSQSTANSGSYYGVYSNPSYTAASGNTLSFLYGGNFSPYNGSTGTISYLYGLYSGPNNTVGGSIGSIYGLSAAPTNSSSGSITSMYGISAVTIKSGTGTIGTAYALYGQVRNNNATGAITTGYGLYIDTPATTGAITNNWGIYQADTAGLNYFGNKSSFGTTTATAYLNLAPSTTSQASLRLVSSAGTDPSSANSGDLWWNGTNLYFNDGGSNTDLLAGGGCGGSCFEQGGNAFGATGVLGTTDSNDVSVITNGTNKLYIQDSTGNVGVGNNNPTSLFSVGSSSEFQIDSSGNIVNLGGAAHSIANSSGALNIDSASTGAINIGTSSNAKTITVGNTTGATGLVFNSGTAGISSTSTATSGNAFSYTANSLSSGNGLYVTSTAASFSGSLAKIFWNPTSGSTATGDLFTIDTAGGSVLGNLFNVKDGGSSLFSVSQTQVTSTIPVQFNAPGDVAIAYDIVLTNPVASFVKSNSNLNLQAGASFASSNLTLSTFNSGMIVLDSATVYANGNVGIGVSPSYKLDVLASGTGVIARFNSANTTGCTLATGGTISCSSDVKLKQDIADINYGIGTVMQLRPVSFNWRNQDNPYKSLGFIAQDVNSILPNLVTVDSASGNMELNSIGFIPILTKAIQDQQEEITAMQSVLGISTNGSAAHILTQENILSYLNNTTIPNFKVKKITINEQLIAKSVVVVGDTTFIGKVSVGSDTAGKATIKAGESNVKVMFSSSYQEAPIVTVTAVNSSVIYKVKNISNNGFTIELSNPETSDIEFNWITVGITQSTPASYPLN